MNKAIIPTILISVILSAAAFARQEPMMKRHEPTMKSIPVMRPRPMMKKTTAAPAIKKKRKTVKKYAKITAKKRRMVRK